MGIEGDAYRCVLEKVLDPLFQHFRDGRIGPEQREQLPLDPPLLLYSLPNEPHFVFGAKDTLYKHHGADL